MKRRIARDSRPSQTWSLRTMHERATRAASREQRRRIVGVVQHVEHRHDVDAARRPAGWRGRRSRRPGWRVRAAPGRRCPRSQVGPARGQRRGNLAVAGADVEHVRAVRHEPRGMRGQHADAARVHEPAVERVDAALIAAAAPGC